MGDTVSWRDDLDREFQIAWAAGVLDARGVWDLIPRIDGKRVSPYDPRGVGTYAPRLGMRVHTKEDPLAQTLIDLLGGTVASRHGRRWWQLSGAKGCAAATEAVLFHLRVQGEKARLHLRYCRRITEYKKASFEERTIPDDEKKVRAQLAQAFFNKR